MTPEDINNVTIEPQDDSTVKISGEIPFADLEKHRAAAVKHLGKNITVDGFREGNIPEKVLVERIGEGTLLSEMAERAMSEAYPEIVKTHKVEVIGYPQISITKLAQDNPLGFTASVAVMPEITLPDYKALAKEVNANKESADVTDEDVEKQIGDILRQKAAYDRMQEKAAKQSEEKPTTEDGATELPTPETVAKEEEEEGEPEAPELTEELVQTLGQPGQFKDIADFRAKIREHLTEQKQQESVSKHRGAITDSIVEKSEMIVPQVMVDAEMNQMFAQMEQDLERAGLKMDDYMKHLGKTKEAMQEEWKPAAEKRAKLQLVLNAIAEKEQVTPDETQLKEEVDRLVEQHKDADTDRVRVYVASVLTNEEVMKMLEAQ